METNGGGLIAYRLEIFDPTISLFSNDYRGLTDEPSAGQRKAPPALLRSSGTVNITFMIKPKDDLDKSFLWALLQAACKTR